MAFVFFFSHPPQIGLSSNTLNTSKDIVCGVPSISQHATNRKRPTTQQESDTKPSVRFHSGVHSHSGTVLRDVSFNDVDEWMTTCKRPLLCSTPSYIFKQKPHCHQTSISEISSFSCDKLDKPLPVNKSTANDLMSKSQKHGILQKSKEFVKQNPEIKTLQQLEEHAKYTNAQSQLRLDKCQPCSSIEFVSAQPHLKQLKER